MSARYALKDRDGTIHDESNRKREALHAQKEYGGMVIRSEHGSWKPYRRHRVFLWFFLAVQAIFLIWLITGIHGNATTINPSVVAQCHHQAASMGMTQAQCVSSLGGAAKTGTAIGAGLIVILWVIVDFLLAVTYGIYRLARR
jgi:hypothetical protein